jgi:regulatory protein YycH of two-component signal transduction system YycFG
MKQGKIKNIILIAMVLVCIYLSSNVWLKLPSFLEYNTEAGENEQDEIVAVDIWNVVRPIKNVIKYNDNYTITYSDEKDVWGKVVHVINDAFDDFDNSSINELSAFPSQYLKLDFSTNIPVEIFTGHMKIDNKDINDIVKNIKNVIIDLENRNVIYIYNGENTIKIESSSINTEEISNIVKQFDFSIETQYAFEQKIGEETIQVPIPMETTASSPVLVQSELDVFDTETINQIAKDYFKNNYDYVRKSVEVSGNTVFMYRTEKILKINAEGLLDFYDTTAELENSSDVYKSLVTAVNFTEEFLGFPEDGYLSDVETIEYEGNYGYRYIFSYKILDRPILFSKVRENAALQIDVVGDSVISYKRFIRNKDDSQAGKMNDIQILPALEVILKNLDDDSNIQEPGEIPELKPLKKEIIKDISNIYLGYFDLSRVSREQNLRVVWVIEAGDKSYIFNAISGALIEEWQ